VIFTAFKINGMLLNTASKPSQFPLFSIVTSNEMTGAQDPEVLATLDRSVA